MWGHHCITQVEQWMNGESPVWLTLSAQAPRRLYQLGVVWAFRFPKTEDSFSLWSENGEVRVHTLRVHALPDRLSSQLLSRVFTGESGSKALTGGPVSRRSQVAGAPDPSGAWGGRGLCTQPAPSWIPPVRHHLEFCPPSGLACWPSRFSPGTPGQGRCLQHLASKWN